MNTKSAVGYAVGDLGINLYFISVMTYLLYFYTDVLGISAVAASGVFMVARLIDAITDPIMGIIAERTRTRWGRMRPYILFGALPLALITVLTFTVPDTDSGGRLTWAYTTYILFGIVYTVVTIPYATLTASLTSDYEERTKVSTFRIGCAFAGGFIVSVGTMPFVNSFASQAEGFQMLMVVFGCIASIFLVVTFVSTNEIVVPSPQKRPSLVDSLRAVGRNPPLLVVIGIFCCGMLSFTVRQSVTAYFFIYNVGDAGLISWFFGLTLGCMLVGIWFVPNLAGRFGKAGAIRLGAYLTIVASVGFYFTSTASIEWIFFWGCLVALGGTPVAVLGWAMIPDTVEYAQLRHGVRADGTIFSTASFFQKLAKAIGGAGTALILGVAGYQAHAAQTPQALAAIHGVLTLIPIGIMLIVIVLTKIYTLDKRRHGDIVAKLAAESNA
ncbi:MAG: MFS transporter [Gammaproteobacteria bacterium]|nr:MFS transporter [Gammaproteobacteria bacterium]